MEQQVQRGKEQAAQNRPKPKMRPPAGASTGDEQRRHETGAAEQVIQFFSHIPLTGGRCRPPPAPRRTRRNTLTEAARTYPCVPAPRVTAPLYVVDDVLGEGV